MPISSGFSQDLNPDYYIRKPAKKELLDETIYHRKEEAYERPVEIIQRPVIKETVFLPDRQPAPLASTRDLYTVVPQPQAPQEFYAANTTTTTTTNAAPTSSFSLIPALGLNADCPCWSWICIVLGILILLFFIGLCLYFILDREGRI